MSHDTGRLSGCNMDHVAIHDCHFRNEWNYACKYYEGVNLTQCNLSQPYAQNPGAGEE